MFSIADVVQMAVVNRRAVFLLFLLFLGSISAISCSQNGIGVQAGGARGAAAPPKFWATQIFWAARENLGKASF